jgi:toxin ParE1/3/4
MVYWKANRYYNLIVDEIECISKFWGNYRFGAIRKNYKFSKVKSHLVFYKEKYWNGRENITRKMDKNETCVER